MKHIILINKKLKKLLFLARIAAFFGEVPVSAMIFSDRNFKVIAYGINNRQHRHKVIGHAEINAIISAERRIKDWRLNNYAIFSVLKPCNMCAEVIISSRIDKIYYLIDQPNVASNPNIEYEQLYFPGNNFAKKFTDLLSSFFKNKR